MKTVLIIGSIICCLISGWVFLSVLSDYSPNSSFSWRDMLSLAFDATLIFLGFAPAIMLFQVQRKGKPSFRFILLTELFLIGLVLATLIIVSITNSI
jgi:TRAP-type C4-dicarboxylate transport system permease small subunit